MAVVNGYKASPPPALANSSFMTKQGWDTFFSLIDGVTPAVVAASKVTDSKTQLSIPDDELEKKIDAVLDAFKDPPPRDKVIDFLGSRTIDDERFRNDCIATLAGTPQRFELGKVMHFIG